MFRVGILMAGKPVGQIAFPDGLLVDGEDDYECGPPGLLTLEEVQNLCGQLMKLPAVHSGKIGKYQWREIS